MPLVGNGSVTDSWEFCVSIAFRDSQHSEYALSSQYTKILNVLGILIC